MSRGIFSPDWSPKQELKLLEALEEYGYGNWSSVSLKTGKTPNECKAHYDHHYMMKRHHFLPEFPFRKVEPALHKNLVQSKKKEEQEKEEEEGSGVYYPGTEINGYMPRRGDFAYEAEDDAESIIADLDTDGDHDGLTMALYHVALQIYQYKLTRRAFRKRIVKEYGLLDIHKQNAIDASRLSRHQQRTKVISRPFLRFMSPTNSAKFLQSHFLEEQLCSEMKKLCHYRENGITTFKGVSLYERLLSERKHRKACQKTLLRKNYSAEENILYQVLHQGLSQGSFKPRKQAPKEHKKLDITYSIGVEKLDEEERELCSYCRFQPEAYLRFKKQMISECAKLGKLTLADSRKLLKVDVNKTRRVYDLLIARGLIHSTNIVP